MQTLRLPTTPWKLELDGDELIWLHEQPSSAGYVDWQIFCNTTYWFYHLRSMRHALYCCSIAYHVLKPGMR